MNLGIGVLALAACAAGAVTIEVPGDFPTIQEGVDAASDGDTVLVAPGTYVENVVLAGKRIRLASNYLRSRDLADVRATVIDGADGDFTIRVDGTVDPETTITGFTIQNAGDGVLAHGRFRFITNWVRDTADGLDYEDGSGGLIRSCLIEDNRDDAVDLDQAVDIVIERSILRNNGDDGIEVRLHDLPNHGGPDLEIVIRRNEISGNGEDGIQLIDGETLSPRVFHIYRNLILDNEMVGLGMMADMNTEENFEGADLGERVLLVSNTFSGNDHAVTGGYNLISLNNLFVDSTNIALKRASGDSIAAYNLFFGNDTDFSNSNVDLSTSVFGEDPLLDPDFALLEGSPAIDAGTAFFEVAGEIILDLPDGAYRGSAPDLGASESSFEKLPPLPAFPCAAGFGAIAEGGRSGDVYHVTNLSDDNEPGSLRYGITSADGPRTIVFDTGGTIELDRWLTIDGKQRLTIAGQTAPGDGITVATYPLGIRGGSTDIVIRFIRFRTGDYNAMDPDGGGNGNMDLEGQGGDVVQIGEVQRVILDHVTASWSMDEAIEVDHAARDVTVQYSLISESLNDSFHHKGEHGDAALLQGDLSIEEHEGGTGGTTFYRNLIAHHNLRNPVVGGQRDLEPGQTEEDRGWVDVDFVNNVVYDWGERSGHTARHRIRMNYVGNYLVSGPSTEAGNLNTAMREETEDEGDFLIYYTDNFMDTDGDADHDGELVGDEAFLDFEAEERLDSPWAFPAIDIAAAEEAYELVLEEAGASRVRDSVDRRIVDDVHRRTGAIIDSQDDVGGLPTLDPGASPTDTDGDGMPDTWEQLRGLDPSDAADRNFTDLSNAGYTNLEMYLNQLAGSRDECGYTELMTHGGLDARVWTSENR